MQNLLKYPYGRNIFNMKNIYPIKLDTTISNEIMPIFYTNSNVTYGGSNNTPSVDVISTSATTYAMPSTNTILIATASSNAITITLPTAIGIQKVYYKIVRTDTTLTNAITINTTSSQTIGGSGTSRKMYTANEVWEFESDGANWQIINHFAKTDFITLSSPSITGSSSNPSLGTLSEHSLKWKREGKNIIVIYRLVKTAGGSSGTGSYLFQAVPNGITIDTSLTGTFTTLTTAGAPWSLNSSNPTLLLSNVVLCVPLANDSFKGIMSVYDTNKIRIFLHTINSTGSLWRSGYYGFANTIIHLSMTYIVPITEFNE